VDYEIVWNLHKPQLVGAKARLSWITVLQVVLFEKNILEIQNKCIYPILESSYMRFPKDLI